MAIPASFQESNMVLNPPEGMTLDQCSVLSVLRAFTPNMEPVVVSCWKLTPEELAEINRTGRVWVTVWGITMPPIAVDGKKWFQG